MLNCVHIVSQKYRGERDGREGAPAARNWSSRAIASRERETRDAVLEPTLTERDEESALAGPAVCLRISGLAGEVELPLDRDVFTVGSSQHNDVVVKHPKVSKLHCALLRAQGGLRVEDKGSKNGVFVAGARVSTCEVGVGRGFELGTDVRVLVLDARLRRLRRALALAVGLAAHDAIDDALRELRTGAPFALVGARGCDQERIAAAIADATRPGCPFEIVRSLPQSRSAQTDLARSLARGTVLLDLHVLERATQPFTDLVLDGERGIRVLASTPDRTRLVAALAPHRVAFCAVELTPLARRRAEIPELLQELLSDSGEDEAARAVRTLDLVAFSGAPWAANMDELRAATPVMAALIKVGTAAGAATLLGWTRAKMRHWLKTYDLGG